ncbi:hypothetical protein ACMFMG_002737 [Clarireedia jacksonii]
MRPLYSNWASGVSPHYPELVKFTNELYKSLLSDRQAIEEAKSCDFGYTSAGWFPSSNLEKLKFMAIYCAWFFSWDDIIDSEDASLEYGAQYRAEAIEYIRYQLGLAHLKCTTTEPKGSTPQLAVFADVGKYVRENCDGDVTRALFAEIERIIACCGKQQESAGKLPSRKEYWDMRFGTSGVNAYCVLAPHMCGVQLPWELFHSSEMRAVWKEININIIIFNDVISLKKEIAANAIISLIPVTMAETGVGLEAAAKMVYEELIENCRAFDEAVELLRQKAKEYDISVQADTDKLIECYEAFLTGVMNWTYTNARYRVAKDITEDGTLITTL